MQTSQAFRRRLADRTAMPMFCLSLFFLTAVSVLVVLWVDVPRLVETQRAANDQAAPSTGSDGTQAAPPAVLPAEDSTTLAIGYVCLAILDILWPIFLLEYCFQYFLRDRTSSFLAAPIFRSVHLPLSATPLVCTQP